VVEQLTAVDATTYLYRLTHSKTDQTCTGQHTQKPIVGMVAEALAEWLRMSGVKEGAIFRRIRGAVVAEPLEPQAVRAIVKRRAAMAGLTAGFSAHSLRSGFMTEAGRQNVPLAEAMSLTWHRSVATALRHFQMGEVKNSRAGDLLGIAKVDKG